MEIKVNDEIFSNNPDDLNIKDEKGNITEKKNLVSNDALLFAVQFERFIKKVRVI
jgi:hypothetical protein